jgi:hypothetical protein
MQLSGYCSIHLTGVVTEDLLRQYLSCNELVLITGNNGNQIVALVICSLISTSQFFMKESHR